MLVVRFNSSVFSGIESTNGILILRTHNVMRTVALFAVSIELEPLICYGTDEIFLPNQ